jgi:dTDP-4-dehydrorhamnose reductase
LKNNTATILVTGANGQLGCEIKALALKYPGYHFVFISKEELSIDDFDKVAEYFAANDFDFCINCAAYTAVDKAEAEREKAFLINTDAVANLARLCNQHKVQLIHISTDYVFDGEANQPYQETDQTNPLAVYGQSKLKGEILALQNDPGAVIIRTSWLYSSYKNNFVKTMLRLMNEKDSINVVSDQFGCPTYAADLAEAVIQIISSGKSKINPGIYHYSNAGIITWYQFAVAIKKLSGSKCIVNPVSTAEYPTASKRPAYTALDTSKIKDQFNIDIPKWELSLEKCFKLLT